MSELNSNEMNEGIATLREVIAKKGYGVERSALEFRLGLEALKKPESPRMVFEAGTSLEDQISALEDQLQKLRHEQLTHLFYCGTCAMYARILDRGI